VALHPEAPGASPGMGSTIDAAAAGAAFTW